jgi:hypothetical protein
MVRGNHRGEEIAEAPDTAMNSYQILSFSREDAS